MDVREKTSNEKRMIDANAFLKDILTGGIGKTIIEYSESDIGYMIRKRPTEDALEVVRCRECCHLEKGYRCRTPLGAGLYNEEYILVDPEDDFCSYGEKRRDKDGTT